MMNYISSTILIIVLGMTATANAAEKENVTAEFPVTPLARYRLSFEAKDVPEKAAWELRIINDDGELPYDGCFKQPWQTITPDQTTYHHSFLTPRDAATLRFIVHAKAQPPTIENVKLDALPADAPIVLNGDFAGGVNDYSGWNERYNAALIEKDSETVLKVNHNGYALTDFFPVAAGGEYKYAPKSAKGTVYAYDANRHLIAKVPYHHKTHPTLIMPANAAFARILFGTWWDHIPKYRTNTIEFANVEPVGEEGAPARLKSDPEAGEIILTPNCDPREERAARELQYWLMMITGKTMPLLAQPSASKNRKIHIGAARAKDYQDDLAFLNDSDGFAVRTNGDDVHVFGATPRGTLFGVYALLERNTDIIWPRPNANFAAVFSKQASIEFSNVDFRSKPAFAIREISFAGHSDPMTFRQWQSRNKINTPFGLGKGFKYQQWRMGALISAGSGYFFFLGKCDDKSFYPLVDGKRKVSTWVQPCYTNPDVVKAIIKKARELLESVPGKKIDRLMCRIGDNWSVCACEECMKPITLPDGSTLKPKSPYSTKDPLFFSTRNFMMLNKIAETLTKDYPDLKIHTHAYIFTAEPPKVKLNPAIVPHFAAYPSQNARFPILAGKANADDPDIWKRRFLEWRELKKDGMGCFGYYDTPGFNALADTAGADYQALAESGGTQVHTEGFPTDLTALSMWDVDGVEKWIIAQLMWDPSRTPEDLRLEYIDKVYREAAPEMRRFFKLINDAWHDESNETFVNCHSTARDLFQEFIVKPGLEKRLRALLKEAEKKADNPKSEAMIKRTLAHFEELSATLGRHVVPLVEESTQDWNDAVSTHWEKALKFDDFKKVDDWRVFRQAPADHQTDVRIMRDHDTVYFRFKAFDDAPEDVVTSPASTEERFPNGDRIEIVLADKTGNHRYFAVGPNGNHYDEKNWSNGWNSSWRVATAKDNASWTAMVAIPLADLAEDSLPSSVLTRFGRVHRLKGPEREESTPSGRSLYNRHDSFWNKLVLSKTTP